MPADLAPSSATLSSATMRAVLLEAPGGPERLVPGEVPVPALKPGHVRVRIAASAVNPVDTKIRAGLPIAPADPAILGCDLAGTVAAVGEGVTDFAVGDAVYGCAGGVKGQGGTLAEYIVADARLLAPRPRGLSMRAAAALPLVAITAVDAFERAGLAASEHVLIHGGAGGVGHVAIQLAKARGARVAATASSAEKAVLVRSLGADEIILYREEAVADYVARLTGGRGFDLVFDAVGGANLANSFAAARLEGRVATTSARATLDLSLLHGRALSLHAVFMLLPMLTGEGRERHGRVLRELAALVDAGKVRPLLDPHRFTLAQAADAHRLLESGTAVGKIVVDVAEGLD